MASAGNRSKQEFESAVLRSRWMALGIRNLLCLTVIFAAVGCGESGTHSNHLPAPLRNDVPYELSFQGSRVWEPECFEVNRAGVLHRIVLASVEPTPPDHPQRQIAVDTLRDFVGIAKGRAVVQGRDRFQREIAQVFVLPVADHRDPGHLSSMEQTSEQLREFDVGLRLIELGLARCSSTEMNHQEEYQRAEAKARAEKRGLWKVD